MKSLFNLIKWDARLLLKYGIAYVAMGITVLYVGILVMLDSENMDKVLLTLVYSDPVMYGFMFTAIMVLFEKEVNIHQVFSVTALPKSFYLLSKATVFALLALVCSIPIVIAYQADAVQWIILIIAIVFSASLFSFIGIVGALYVKSFNQFILVIPMVMAPICLPFLSFYEIWHSHVFYLIPTQACLILFEASLMPKSSWAIIYAILYLLMWNVLAFYWARKALLSKF